MISKLIGVNKGNILKQKQKQKKENWRGGGGANL